jgi:DNA-binding transcriptional LysR family regulator
MISANRLHNLDLSTLRSFSTIAETGSMTRAASRLFMTQSAISMQIKRLETSLDFKVFERSAQGMNTTQPGEQLLQYAHQMLALNDEVMNRLMSPEYEGTIRLGVPCDIIYPHIPTILKDFNRDFPRVQIKLSASMTHKLLREYNNGSQDIVLTTEKNVGKEGKVIRTQSLIWTGAENGNAWKKRPLPLGISRNCAYRSIVTQSLDESGLTWVDVVASEDVTAGEAMISADLCVGVELESVAMSGRVPIENQSQMPPLPEFSIGLYHRETPANDISGILIDYLLRAFQ